MARRREILDSEDDGSDYAEEPEVGANNAHNERVPRDTDGASHNVGTDSTDVSFFQRIYDQQSAAVDVQYVVPDTAPPGPAVSTWTEASSAPAPGQKPQAKDLSSLTSVTDSAPSSRGPKRTTREAHHTEVIDLTDSTTPSKEAARGTGDVRDVPTSTRSQRAARTYGKRNTAQLSLEQEAVPNALPDTQDPYAFPDATPPTRDNKRAIPSSSAQRAPNSSPVMLVPTEEALSSDKRTRSSRKKRGSFGMESVIPDTAIPSLYVTQSTLTASQKQEYRAVSLSSEAMPEAPGTWLLGQSLGVGDVYKSSGSATTIAYPTPSRIGSSRRLPDVAKEMGGDGAAAASLGPEADYQSSPDILNDMTTAMSVSGSKRSRIKLVTSTGLTSSVLEPPPSTRRAKRRKVARETENDAWERDPLGHAEENDDTPQADINDEGIHGELYHSIIQPGTDVSGQTSVPKIDPVDAEVLDVPEATPKPTTKGKRGRKKKGAKKEEPNPELTEPAPADVQPDPAVAPIEESEPPAKRKRGRPRKSTPTQPQIEPEDEQEPEQQPAEETQAEAKTDTSPQPLSELHHNSQPGPAARPKEADIGDAGGDIKENGLAVVKVITGTEAAKGKEKDKQAIKDTKADVQKVQYRVGLSKRSRIAPLLKSLKKPV